MLGPPQYECIGRVSGRYSVERTPEFAIVELGPAQYKVLELPGSLPQSVVPAQSCGWGLPVWRWAPRAGGGR